MSKLPDFEGLAIFAKIVELRSFAAAADDLTLSRATVSKAIGRLEKRLGRALSERARRVLAEGEAAEDEALAQSGVPCGLVRLAVPMSFGLARIAPILPEFLARYPEISIDLHLSDQIVDLIGDGFDAALRIGALPDSSLIASRLCDVGRHVVGAPAYFDRYGRPTHPMQLAEHRCLGYAYMSTPDLWQFTSASGETASIRPLGPLRVTNGEALLPALIAGLGITLLPDFIVGDTISSGRLEAVLADWVQPPRGLHLITPPGGPRPARVELLLSFLRKRLSGGPGGESAPPHKGG
jgi:DNA-binding transcriptional LysR family regulator